MNRSLIAFFLCGCASPQYVEFVICAPEHTLTPDLVVFVPSANADKFADLKLDAGIILRGEIAVRGPLGELTQSDRQFCTHE